MTADFNCLMGRGFRFIYEWVFNIHWELEARVSCPYTW